MGAVVRSVPRMAPEFRKSGSAPGGEGAAVKVNTDAESQGRTVRDPFRSRPFAVFAMAGRSLAWPARGQRGHREAGLGSRLRLHPEPGSLNGATRSVANGTCFSGARAARARPRVRRLQRSPWPSAGGTCRRVDRSRPFAWRRPSPEVVGASFESNVRRGRLDACESMPIRATRDWLSARHSRPCHHLRARHASRSRRREAFLNMSLPGVDELLGLLEIERLRPPTRTTTSYRHRTDRAHLRLLATPALFKTFARVLDLMRKRPCARRASGTMRRTMTRTRLSRSSTRGRAPRSPADGMHRGCALLVMLAGKCRWRNRAAQWLPFRRRLQRQRHGCESAHRAPLRPARCAMSGVASRRYG